MATDPDGDAVTYLAANIPALTKDVNLFASKEMAAGDGVPHEAVFVLAAGGPAPEAYADGTTTELWYPALQVITRSKPRDYNGGLVLARLVLSTLHHAPLAGYVDVRVNESEPNHVAETDAGSHVWSNNFELWNEE